MAKLARFHTAPPPTHGARVDTRKLNLCTLYFGSTQLQCLDFTHECSYRVASGTPRCTFLASGYIDASICAICRVDGHVLLRIPRDSAPHAWPMYQRTFLQTDLSKI